MSGNGTIRQRGDAFELRYQLGGKTRTTTFHGTKQQAKAKLRELLARVDRGAKSAPSRDTFAAWNATWQHAIRAEIGPMTLRLYEQHSRVHLVPALGSHRLREIDAATVRGLWADLGDKLSASTIRTLHRVLSACMSYAVDSGKIDINPCANWRKGRGLPKLIKAEIKPLTADEARRLVDLARTGIRRGKRARQPWLWAPAVIALAIGARRSEIAALDWPRINLETGEVAIFESLRQFSAKDVRRGGTKTGEARNPVLPAWAIAELIEWRKVQREQLLKAGIRTDAVCTYPEGNAVLPDAMTLGFRALAKAIGRPDVTFHGQRHTAASWVLDSGASIKAAQVMLGHGSAVTTLAIYGHAMPGNEKATADKLQEAFSR